MKTYLLAGALLAFAAAPQAASAQAVGADMSPGAIIQGQPRFPAPAGQSAPARTAVPQRTPLQPGTVFTRPSSAFNPGNSGLAVVLPEAPSRSRSSQWSGREWNGDNAPSQRINAPIGPANGFFDNSIPPIGPGNGFFNNLTPPVGPANGFSSTPAQRVTTPYYPQGVTQGNCPQNYIYTTTVNTDPIIAGGPPLLGGYYYGGYCDSALTTGTYPSVYSVYAGFPQFIFQPNVIVAGQPDYPVYVTNYQPFNSPTYQVTYNNNYYYVANEDRARQMEAGGDQAQAALQNAFPVDSYQAAFADIARAWTDGDIQPLRRHIRDTDTRISVSLNKKYSYSIASGDFVQITRDALDKLGTVSFEFTAIRKAKSGDMTAFGKHVYRATSTDNTASPDPQTNDAASGDAKTVYVSYTLRHRDDLWYIVAVDSSADELVPAESR